MFKYLSRLFGQIFDQVFGEVFDQGFDQGFDQIFDQKYSFMVLQGQKIQCTVLLGQKNIRKPTKIQKTLGTQLNPPQYVLKRVACTFSLLFSSG